MLFTLFSKIRLFPRRWFFWAEITKYRTTCWKEQVVKQAEGVAQNFTDVYNSYVNAKDVTIRRIYLETLREVLEGPNKIILDDSGNGQGVVPYLPLNEINKNRVNN